MWVEVKKAHSLMLAEMWKELFEGEGVPTRVLPDPESPRLGETASYRVLVPSDKTHIVDEVLRKI